MLPFQLLCLTAVWTAATSSARYIVPGGRWRDTDGNLANAHAGNVVHDPASGKFYWFGEYKLEGQVEGGGVSVYSSDDLATWTHHGLALAPIEGDPILGLDKIIQRPKVIYSEVTSKYHMLWHADNSTYGLLLQGLAQSDNITGPYEFVSATQPLGNWSQDYGLFTDYKDGRSYALYSNGDTREGRDDYITSYNDAVTELDEVVYRFNKFDLEAPGIVQTDSSYYILMSHKTGYRPNDVVAFRADNLAGPWSQPFNVAPADTRTYNSQSGFILRINGTKQVTNLYLGDQWDSNSLWESRYIWLPIEIDDEKKSLEVVWNDVYDLDAVTGEWSPVEGTPYYAHDAETTGDAFLQEATFASGGLIATGIYGNDSKVTFSGIEGTGEPQWVSFYYQNTDDMGFGNQPGGSPDRIGGTWQLRRIASVMVNGDTENLETLFQRDTNKGIILSTPLQLTLEKGSNNTITIGGLYNGFDYKGADIDRLVVYPPETSRNLTASATRRSV
ncbi:glycosyl hydrolase family 43 protein [Diaporthe helianthi]|uniref:Glycosyl hydrolase family 43 protein n=1 Tax=Diaporthe helianthi TaxID=158607 RepID=A0A2P5HQN1_DIAHE|nr:glycosyl hydrolase family 43 protein [Diaporthe helianthi]